MPNLRSLSDNGTATWRLLPIISALSFAYPACQESNAEGGLRVNEFRRLVAYEEMRIGQSDDPGEGFSRVTGVDVDDDRSIYILEALVPEIRVYNPDGMLVRRIGRRGAGPGEFRSPPRFGLQGDTLWAVDVGAHRITLFNREGTVLSTGQVAAVVVALPNANGHLLPWFMRPDGRLTSHFARVSSRFNDPQTGDGATDSVPVPIVLFDVTGAVLDTIGWAARPPPRLWRPPPESEGRVEFVQVGNRQVLVPSPPTRMPWWLPLPDGYVLVEAALPHSQEDATFTVARVGLSGDTAYIRRFHVRPARYSSADLDSIAARGARGEGTNVTVSGGGRGLPGPGETKAITRALRSAMRFPTFKLPIEYPWLAQDESVWVRLRGDSGETVEWMLLDVQGNPRGRLELQSHLRVMWSRGDIFWALETDQFDVPWAVRFRLQPG